MILEKTTHEFGEVVRTWVWQGERDLAAGYRIFREQLAPVEDEKENPVFDELRVKEPLKFGVDGQTFGKMAKRYGKK
jgi:hypothetical protein